jgi:hypothetical protein
MQTAMDKFFSRRLEESYLAIMIDGMRFGKMTIVAASLKEGMERDVNRSSFEIIRSSQANRSPNTNALESANSTCAGIIRRVTHFKNGEVALRQAAAGFMEAERSFRRIRGYREILILQSALTNLTGIKRKGKIEVA